MRKATRRVGSAWRKVLGKSALRGALAASCLSSAACSYIETMLAREADPDDRIVLAARDGNVFVSRADLDRFICVQQLLLVCETGGGVKYSCYCALR